MQVPDLIVLYKTLSAFPLGKTLFSYLIRYVNPYSGSLGARVEHLEAGYVEVTLASKRRNANHLDSIHAIALTNLGELCSGLAVLSSLNRNERGIVTHINVDFLLKARGFLRATSRCVLPNISEDSDFLAYTEIFNDDGECVARVEVTWRLGLKEEDV